MVLVHGSGKTIPSVNENLNTHAGSQNMIAITDEKNREIEEQAVQVVKGINLLCFLAETKVLSDGYSKKKHVAVVEALSAAQKEVLNVLDLLGIHTRPALSRRRALRWSKQKRPRNGGGK